MGFSREGSQGGQFLIVVLRARGKDIKLAPNRTLDPAIAAEIPLGPFSVDSPIAVIGDLETSARPGFMMKNPIVHPDRQESCKRCLDRFLHRLAFFFTGNLSVSTTTSLY